MVVSTKMEKSGETTQQTRPVASKAIGIPQPVHQSDAVVGSDSPTNKAGNKHMMRFLEEERRMRQDEQKNKAVSAGSPKDGDSDEDFIKMPDGSPCFNSVMSQMSVDISHVSLAEDPKSPISPLAIPNGGEIFDPENADSKNDVNSPTVTRKLISNPARNSATRSRSYSWNYRNKMALERRKQLALSIPHSQEPSSTHSSPLLIRKSSKSKSQPTTPQLVHIFPKYKFLTETISVSHEDLVKEQERERHLADGFQEVKSIFDNPAIDRYSETPPE